jgi:hypothetical protein
MLAGLIGTVTAVPGITTSYNVAQPVLMSGSIEGEKRALPLPADADLGSLDIVVQGTAGLPTSISCYLTWDANGDHRASRVLTLPLEASLTTAGRSGGSVVVGAFAIAPTSRQSTAGRLYLWAKTDVGTVTLHSAYLGWRLGGKRS